MNKLPMKLSAPASPHPAADSTKAMKRLCRTSTPTLIAARSLSRTLISPRPKLEVIILYSAAMVTRVKPPASQNMVGSNQSKSISLLVASGTPEVPPTACDFIVKAPMISANTHIAIEK